MARTPTKALSLLKHIKYNATANCINTSTYSNVYLTHNFVIKEQKIISHEGFESNLKEILFLIQLKHKNIISIYAIEPNPFNDTFSIILPRYDCPLNVFLEQINIYKRVDIGERIIYDLLNGVSYLHSLGIIHSDIKPSNVFVRYVNKPSKIFINIDSIILNPALEITNNGYLINDFDIEIVIADFNLSQLVINWEAKTDIYVQTDGYRAPEVYIKRYDYRIDIWSIGCIILDMFNGGGTYWNFELSAKKVYECITIKQLCKIFMIPYSGIFSNDYVSLIKKISPEMQQKKWLSIVQSISKDYIPNKLFYIMNSCLTINKDIRKNAYTILKEFYNIDTASPLNKNVVNFPKEEIEMTYNKDTIVYQFQNHTRLMALKLYNNLILRLNRNIEVIGANKIVHDINNIYSYDLKTLKRFCYYFSCVFFDDNSDYLKDLFNKYNAVNSAKILFNILKFITKYNIDIILSLD